LTITTLEYGIEHDVAVRRLEDEICSLGLMVWRKTGPFSQGFSPDIITNIDGTTNGWILIDVLNKDDSANRVIGGLLVVKANVEKAGNEIKGVLLAVTENVNSLKDQRALLDKENIIAFRRNEFKAFIQSLMERAK